MESKLTKMIGVKVPATVTGSVVIQHKKSIETCETAMRCIAQKCKLDETDKLLIITDDEAALINASERGV